MKETIFEKTRTMLVDYKFIQVTDVVQSFRY